MIVIDFTDPDHWGGSWLRRHRVRCERCHRVYYTLAVTTAACPQCGEPGPFIVDCSPIEIVPPIRVLVSSLEMATLPDGPRPRRYDRSSACHRCGRQLVAQTPKLVRTMYRAHLRTCRRVR